METNKFEEYAKQIIKLPNKKSVKGKDLNLYDKANLILDDGNPTKTKVELVKELVHLQRTIEDTAARKRLENWVKVLIPIYLFVVFVIIIINATCKRFSITDTVIATILSTTTINVLGLAAILMRGMFHVKEKDKDKCNEQNKE